MAGLPAVTVVKGHSGQSGFVFGSPTSPALAPGIRGRAIALEHRTMCRHKATVYDRIARAVIIFACALANGIVPAKEPIITTASATSPQSIQDVATAVMTIGVAVHVSASEKVGQGVMDTLRLEGKAFVIVALKEPQSMKATKSDLPALKREIASLQSDVLSSVDMPDFHVVHKYDAVPGLAGWVTEAGLVKLVAHPAVVRIDLDVGGGGLDAARP